MIELFLGDALGVLSCQFWSIVLQSRARLPIHLKLLDRAVSGARFLTGGVFECDISHRRSVAVLCMLITSGVTRCTLLMVLSLDRMCQRGLHAVLWSVHLCTASLQNLAVQQDFYSLSVSLWNDLANPVFDGVRLACFKSRANASLLA